MNNNIANAEITINKSKEYLLKYCGFDDLCVRKNINPIKRNKALLRETYLFASNDVILVLKILVITKIINNPIDKPAK